MKANVTICCAAMLMLFLSVGCSKTPTGRTEALNAKAGDVPAKRIEIVATVGMVADLVREIGGEQVRVTQLMGAAVDPHLYTASRDDVARLMSAEMIFCVGLMLEGKMNDTLNKLSDSHTIVAVAESLPKSDLIADENHAEAYDPHVWMDISLWIKCADTVRKALVKQDPENQPIYDQRTRVLRRQMQDLHHYGTMVMQTIPKTKRTLITSHDAFGYFGRAYQLQVEGVQGISTESEAGLQRINELVGMIVDKQVPAVFAESSVNGKSLQAIMEGVQSKGQKLRLGGPLFSDAMGSRGTYEGTYIGMLDHNLTTIAKELGGKPPEKGWHDQLSFSPQARQESQE